MRCIDHDLEAVQAVRQRLQQVHHVPVLRVSETVHTAHIATLRAQRFKLHAGLDRVLKRVIELLSAARQELDPVVWRRVVGRRNHDAEIRFQIRDQIRRCRGWERARIVNLNAGS